jgi:23S rRNA (guanosine2251-2'-O)-methyltransferase
VDVHCPAFRDVDQYLASEPGPAAGTRLLALDGISNPANLGMIIRSAAAGTIDGIICPRRGNATLGPLVIKASAGTLYRAPLLRCESLADALRLCREGNIEICILAADAQASLFDYQPKGAVVYVLGNETEGVSPAVEALADTRLAIPMRNGVESLNVAVTASLIAFAPALASGRG